MYVPQQQYVAVGPEQIPSAVIDQMGQEQINEKVDPEYEWFRYSQRALPFLLFILLLATTLFGLTLWQGNTSLKEIRPGVPRHFEIPTTTDGLEAGIPKSHRNFRIAACVFGLVGVALILLTMYVRPTPKARKGAYLAFSFLLIVGAILAFIAFALNAGNWKDATRCRARHQGSVAPPCREYDNVAIAALIVDFLIGTFCLLTAVSVILASLKSREVTEDDYATAPRAVTKTTKELIIILLVVTVVFCLVNLIMVVILHEGRDTATADEAWGTRYDTNHKPGWPVKNTRLRIAATAIVIGLVLFTLFPFRSRVVAYILAFLLFLTTGLFLMAFALDVRAIDEARDMVCPESRGWECSYRRYYAVAFFDIFLALVIIGYILFEFIANLAAGTTFGNDAVELELEAE